jgi:DNA polymerase elongation subunit (family B)
MAALAEKGETAMKKKFNFVELTEAEEEMLEKLMRRVIEANSDVASSWFKNGRDFDYLVTETLHMPILDAFTGLAIEEMNREWEKMHPGCDKSCDVDHGALTT